MAKVVIVKSATNGSERRDGQQAVMAKRVAHHVSARALLQGDGSEGTVKRKNVITNMKVSDADVVKAVNSVFFLERRCCRTMAGLISSQTACRVWQ